MKQGLTLLPRLKSSGADMVHCSLDLPGSSNHTASASLVAGMPSTCHHFWLFFLFFEEMEFCHIAQVGLELLSSSNPPALAFQSARIIDVNYHAWPELLIL